MVDNKKRHTHILQKLHQVTLGRWRIYPINLVLCIILAFWALSLTLVPLWFGPDTVNFGDKGIVGVQDFVEERKNIGMDGYPNYLYKVGDKMCHQHADRSLFIQNNQMPFCARCIGIFLGLALGVGICIFKYAELKWWWLVGGLAPMGIDWGLQSFFTFYHSNISRLLSGTLAGIVTGLALGIIVLEITSLATLEPLPALKNRLERLGNR